MDCNICCESINKSNRKGVVCPYCGFLTCLVCFRRFLLESATNASCMSCKRELSAEFVATSTPKVFHNQEYRRSRTQILYERERSLLPTTQHLAEARMAEKRHKEKIAKQLEDLAGEEEYLQLRKTEIFEEVEAGYGMDTYRRMIASRKKVVFPDDPELNEHVYEWRYIRKRLKRIKRERHRVHNTTYDGQEVEKKERKKFIKPCPGRECRGFLSAAWKCGTCNTYACPECHMVKKSREDRDHVCKPEDLETAKLFATDYKPCPGCQVQTHKIEGCFAADTPILMWNGSTRMSQHIVVGDELIGDDGTKRTVTRLTSGKDMMYTVTQKRAQTYTVNSKHKLSLVFSGNRSVMHFGQRWKVKWFCSETLSSKTKVFTSEDEAIEFRQTLPDQELFDLTIEDFLSLPRSTRSNFKGTRSSGVHWDGRDLALDPYILGMWLGDGYSNGKEFANNDLELVNYWREWAGKNDAEVAKTTNDYRYYVRRARESTKRTNPLKDCLAKYDLINNKHIPTEYLTGSRKVRLSLLAGLVDTDGCVQNGGRRVVIIQTNPILSEQIVYLVRSLGFSCSLTTRLRKASKIFGHAAKDYRDQQHINISGQCIDQMPTILPRKRCSAQEGGVNLLLTDVSVNQASVGEYFGWSVDGNKRFLLGDFTVSHNCDQMWCTECHTTWCWRTGQKVNEIIHNPHFYEWQREQSGGEAPRVPGDEIPNGCGGMPWIEVVEVALETRKIKFRQWEECFRAVEHTRGVTMQRYPDAGGIEDNTDLRVRYLINEIDEEKWKRMLQMRQKKYEKNHAVNQILEMFVITLTDIWNRFAAEEIDIEAETEALRKYVNRSLQTVKQRFNNKVPFVMPDWQVKS